MTKLDKLRTIGLLLNIVSTTNSINSINIDTHSNTSSYIRKKCKSCKKFNDSHDCSYAQHQACKLYIKRK